MRCSIVNRKTAETDISLSIKLDGSGKSKINTGCGFLDHMLTLFSAHSRFDLEVSCKGDTYVDFHHTVEDIGICLGKAFLEALGDKKGIARYGSMLLPMDESLILCAADISGRSELCYSVDIPTQKVGDFDCELNEEFWLSFTRSAQCTLHMRMLSGKNSHHIIEACFKAAARSLKAAAAKDTDFPDEIPSTKGVL